ncbi:MAG: hypothetical protein WA952_02205, partial [Lewinella sp.]
MRKNLPAYLRFLLSFSLLLAFADIQSQALFWVNGSGDWDDPDHWSETSGGISAGMIPDQSTTASFDDQSRLDASSVVTLRAGTYSVQDISVV